MMRAIKKTKDDLGILHRRYYAGHPDRLAALEEMRAAEDVAKARNPAQLPLWRLSARIGPFVN
jgi:hypothetical protein